MLSQVVECSSDLNVYCKIVNYQFLCIIQCQNITAWCRQYRSAVTACYQWMALLCQHPFLTMLFLSIDVLLEFWQHFHFFGFIGSVVTFTLVQTSFLADEMTSWIHYKIVFYIHQLWLTFHSCCGIPRYTGHTFGLCWDQIVESFC